MNRSTIKRHLKKHRAAYYRIVPLFVLAVVVCGIALQTAQPFKSPEVAFTDAAPSGLAIVPASCDSSPQTPDSGSCKCGPAPTAICSSYLPATHFSSAYCESYSYSCPSGYTYDGSWCVVKGSACNNGGGGGPPGPKVTIYAQYSNIFVGQPDDIHATFAAGAGDTLTHDNIDFPNTSTGVGATTDPDSTKDYTFTPTHAGQFTFYAMAQTRYYTSWVNYAQTTVFAVSTSTCQNGMVWNGTACVTPCQNGTVWNGTACVSQCQNGMVWNGTACVTPCQNGTVWNGTACVSQCQNGMVWNGTACVSPKNPSDAILRVNPAEVYVGTPASLSWTANNVSACTISGPGMNAITLTTAAQCENGSVAAAINTSLLLPGTYIYDYNYTAPNVGFTSAALTVDARVCKKCPYGCNNDGICNPPPPADIVTWTVNPKLVQSSQTTTVTWNTIHTTACTVTGTNKDGTVHSTDAVSPGVWSALNGTKTSSPITGQTIYTLSCVGDDGVTVSETATVNIVPVFNEQ